MTAFPSGAGKASNQRPVIVIALGVLAETGEPFWPRPAERCPIPNASGVPAARRAPVAVASRTDERHGAAPLPSKTPRVTCRLPTRSPRAR
jgi:hypothetical protein